ncbi:MAG TPA: heme lyase CcmF/NrfE family subunit [Candidatus Limnocylindria bacterium]|nr:heme lyase CcmF/NrfE family subunit [Candidatus Limnocylindria bacterium]
MTAVVGHASVVVGLALTVYALVAFVAAGLRRDTGVLASARTAIYLTFAAALLACGAMVAALLGHDFSVEYVARNNATTTPPFFSVISLWAALEGSILFWTLLASGWAALVLYRYRHRHVALMPWVGAALAGGLVFFLAVMVWPGDPFVRITPVPSEGPGPNALLQNHPFMGLHPPLLYLGYTGLAIPFGFAVAALVTRRLGAEWLRTTRRWTLAAWIFLTAGIVAGAWWSYEVLGWGGYWAWDPVENAALLPWLTATAFLHSSMVAERRGGLRTWTVTLVSATFVFTILGTFLTRSGVVASVHSFTQSAIGPWFLGGVLLALTASVALIIWRLPDLAVADRPAAAVSRESAFLLNNVLFVALTFAVLFGTLYPLLAEAISGVRVSVGAPWFNAVTVPIALALLFVMGVGPALPWGAASWETVRRRFALPLAVAAVVGTAALLFGARDPAAIATLALAGFVAAVIADEWVRGARARAGGRGEAVPTAAWRLVARSRRRYGGYVVHLGVLVMAVAVAISSTAAHSTERTVRPGETIRIGDYTLTYRGVDRGPLADDARVAETRAHLDYTGPQRGSLVAAVREYPSSATPILTPAVRSGLGEDLYVTLLGHDPATGVASFAVFVNPLVAWIWAGGGVAVAGAIFAAWPDRRPQPARERARRPSSLSVSDAEGPVAAATAESAR